MNIIQVFFSRRFPCSSFFGRPRHMYQVNVYDNFKLQSAVYCIINYIKEIILLEPFVWYKDTNFFFFEGGGARLGSFEHRPPWDSSHGAACIPDLIEVVLVVVLSRCWLVISTPSDWRHETVY